LPGAPAPSSRERYDPGGEPRSSRESSDASRDSTPPDSETARPEYWPDGHPIHYPTQAEIDALLNETDPPILMPRLRMLNEWLGRTAAYVYFSMIVLSMVGLILLVLYRLFEQLWQSF
jgi:hypothetical protein